MLSAILLDGHHGAAFSSPRLAYGDPQIDQQHHNLRQQIAEWLRLKQAGWAMPSLALIRRQLMDMLALHFVDEEQLLDLSSLPPALRQQHKDAHALLFDELQQRFTHPKLTEDECLVWALDYLRAWDAEHALCFDRLLADASNALQTTEPLALQQALAEHEARLKTILSVLQDSILLVNDQGCIEYLNQAFLDMFDLHLPPQQLVGMTAAAFFELIRPSLVAPESDLQDIAALAAAGQPEIGREVRLNNGQVYLRDFLPFSYGFGRYGRLWHLRNVTAMRAVQQDLAEANRLLAALSLTDALTGLGNRRCFDRDLADAWRRCARQQAPLSLILIDIDHFKHFNDRFGHLAGDACLCRVAAIMQTYARRGGDLAVRYGGEEFAMLLPAAAQADALSLAEALRAEVAACVLSLPAAGDAGAAVTLSLGVATLLPGQALDGLFARADAALYQAKARGRNRVEVAPSVSDPRR